MPSSIIRTITTAIAIAALAAPTALASPADTSPAVAKAAAAAAQHKQDVRSPDAVDAATRPPLAGPPTWPVNPQPITSAPTAKVADGGNGVAWATIGLGIAGSLLAIGGIATLSRRRRLRIPA
jgi:hypothetical protein